MRENVRASCFNHRGGGVWEPELVIAIYMTSLLRNSGTLYACQPSLVFRIADHVAQNVDRPRDHGPVGSKAGQNFSPSGDRLQLVWQTAESEISNNYMHIIGVLQ